MVQPALAGDIQAQISGQISGQIAVGNYNLQIGAVHGGVVNVYGQGQAPVPQPRPMPLRVQPRPFPGLLGREAEVAAALAAVQAATPCEFYSPPGWGKTSLLRALAYQPALAALPDGLAYLSATRRPLADVLQCLYDAFYESPTPFKPDDAQLRLALQAKRAVILFDDLDVPRDDLEALLNIAPGCVFLSAAPARTLWGEGRPLPVRGLPPDAALALLVRELGRPLTTDEQPQAQTLGATVGYQPLALVQAAGTMRDSGQSLAQVLQQMQPATPVPAAPAPAAPATPPPAEPALPTEIAPVAGLTAAQQQLLAVLAAVGGASVGQEHLPALTGQADLSAVLQSLLQRGLVQAHSPRVSLTGELPAQLRQAWDLRAWDDRVLAYFTAWAERHRQEPRVIAEEADALQQTLRQAVQRPNRAAPAMRLGRAIEGALALSGLWGAWGRVLGWIGQAATAAADQGATAWVLHQQGTRALCLGDRAAAQASLSQALELRETLGDQIGAAITRHNLSLLLPPPPARDRPPAENPPEETPPAAEIAATTATRGIPMLFRILLGLLVVGVVLVTIPTVAPKATLQIENGVGCDEIPALPFPLGNLPGLAGLDRPIPPGVARQVEIPAALAGQVHLTNAGRLFTLTVGPTTLPFELPSRVSSLMLNNTVIWDTQHADQPLHDIPIDTSHPAVLRVDCSTPTLR